MSEPQGAPELARNPPGAPSNAWLQDGGWIDGARNPPRFYVDRDEMNTDRVAAGYPPLPPLALERTPPPAPTVPVAPPIPGDTAPPLPTAGDNPAVQAPLDSAGHLVSVTITYSTPAPANGRSSRAQKKTKSEKVVKSDHIVLDGTSPVNFIQAALAVHELQEQYRAGTHSGPPIKIWWTGSSGGKSGASTIDNDREFQVTRTEILRKHKDSCKVNVEFDLDNMDGFRVRKRPLSIVAGQDDDDELHRGDKVPRLELFSEEDQLHGRIIVQLKALWACESHLGENGETGYCYVDPSGQHLGLNNRRFKLWSSAIAAADCTKHAPPNTVDFDCVRDARLNVSKPRGRAGPSNTTQSSTSTNDLSTMVMAAMLPIITSHLAPKAPSTPSRSRIASAPSAPTTPTRTQPSVGPQSPSPAAGTELPVCVGDFLKAKGIDLSASEPALAALELTPDIIHEVPVARLCDVMGAVEGRVRKFQVFCKEWTERVEDKRRRGL